MSAHTKPCPKCKGSGRSPERGTRGQTCGRVDCPDCSGTGRVPDVEASLRAELDAARAEAAEVAELRAEVARLKSTGIVDGKPREQLSEGQLMQVDLALSAGLRAVLGLDWSVVDDGFGALGADAAKVAEAISTGWAISHEKTIDAAIDALTARGFGVLRVGGA